MSKLTYVIVGALIAALLVVAVTSWAVPQTQHGMAGFIPELVRHQSRACLFPIGGWEIIDCSDSAAAANSEAFTEWSRYVIQCGDDSYIATGDASTDAADTSDGWLPEGAWLEFLTTDTVKYISCRNKNSDSDCRVWECQ